MAQSDLSENLDHIPETALAWARAGRQVALASVIETWGSAPRQAGAQLVIDAAGAFEGSVSGGCVEAAVVTEAQDAIRDGRCRVLEYGITDDQAFAVGLACGGTIRVLVEPLNTDSAQDQHEGPTLADLTGLVKARRAGRAAVWAVHLTTWQRRLSFGQDDLPGGPKAAAIARRMASDRSGCEGDWFLAIQNPPLRLIVVGAVHIAQALIPMARLAGYDCQLIDPRTGFASPTRFPDTAISHDWPDQVIPSLTPDARTAIVTLTHDPKIDDPALLAGLASGAFYLGCLGSTRTHAKRLDRLRNAGAAADQLQRLHAPVGLDIGARNPAEIAVAILAEVTQCLRHNKPIRAAT